MPMDSGPRRGCGGNVGSGQLGVGTIPSSVPGGALA